VNEVSSDEFSKVNGGYGGHSELSWERRESVGVSFGYGSVASDVVATEPSFQKSTDVDCMCHERETFRGRVRVCREVLAGYVGSRRRRGYRGHGVAEGVNPTSGAESSC
jgi:hypothetical protein